MTPLCYITERRSFQKVAAALFAIAGMAASANGDTIGPSNSLVATFTTVPNSSNMLLLFDNSPLTTTGSPIISVQLYNGASLLGGYTENAGATFLVAEFESLGGPSYCCNPYGPVPTQVSFTSMTDGSVAGRLLLTVTGGTISFNEGDLVLEDALIVASNSYSPRGDLRNISYLVVATTPEPVSGMLVAVGLSVLWLWKRRRAVREC